MRTGQRLSYGALSMQLVDDVHQDRSRVTVNTMVDITLFTERGHATRINDDALRYKSKIYVLREC